MPECVWPEKTALEVMASSALDELAEPLSRLGCRWAESPNRPRPERAAVRLWDEMLDEWVANPNLPHLTTLKSFYVEISRTRDRAELVTDDRTALRERLETATGERIAALEAIEPERAKGFETAEEAGRGVAREEGSTAARERASGAGMERSPFPGP